MNISDKAQKALESLKDTAAKTLDRKQRLGQYAVVWRDEKPVTIGGEATSIPADSKEEGRVTAET